MPKTTPPESGNRPVHTIRHRHLKATIWRNPTEKGTMYNVMVTRSYRDKGTDEWHDTHSIGYDDLMNVAALMHEAHSYVSNRIAKESVPSPKPAIRTAPRTASRPKATAVSDMSSPPEKELPF